MRKLGIIGGSSWASTAMYFEHINRLVGQRLGELHSAPLTIENLDYAPLVALQQSGEWGPITEAVTDAARRLEAAGAEGLLIASNTLHKLYGEVAAATSLPILHIAEAAVERLARDKLSRVALLGTRYTMGEDFIRGPLEARGMAVRPLGPAWEQEVDRIIYQELAAGRVVRDSQRKLKSLLTDLGKQKVQGVLLACTELALAVDSRANVLPVYDSTAIHARAAAEWILADAGSARAAA